MQSVRSALVKTDLAIFNVAGSVATLSKIFVSDKTAVSQAALVFLSVLAFGGKGT